MLKFDYNVCDVIVLPTLPYLTIKTLDNNAFKVKQTNKPTDRQTNKVQYFVRDYVHTKCTSC